MGVYPTVYTHGQNVAILNLVSMVTVGTLTDII